MNGMIVTTFNPVESVSMQAPDNNILEVVSDSICPWCYIGKRRLEGALELLGADAPRVAWMPFQLNPGMPVEGMDRREYRSQKFGSWERSQQLDAQVHAAGEEVGIKFAHDKMLRTPNTLASHKLILFASRAGLTADSVVERIFRAHFVEGRDIGNVGVLAEIGADAGLPRENVISALLDDELGRAVQLEERRSRGLGLNGVPTFVLGGIPLASGAQPKELLANLIAQHTQAPARASCSLDGDCE
jgi:predicted DsbA family dithiol-disulfide isomerase